MGGSQMKQTEDRIKLNLQFFADPAGEPDNGDNGNQDNSKDTNNDNQDNKPELKYSDVS